MERIAKIGSVELYESEAEKLYSDNKYILTSTSVYQIMYSTAQKRFYGRRVYYEKGARFCRPGRYFTFDYEQINKIIGHNLLAM